MPLRQRNGNLAYVVDARRDIGVDRFTGLPTSQYTVINPSRQLLVTTFPGCLGGDADAAACRGSEWLWKGAGGAAGESPPRKLLSLPEPEDDSFPLLRGVDEYAVTSFGSHQMRWLIPELSALQDRTEADGERQLVEEILRLAELCAESPAQRPRLRGRVMEPLLSGTGAR